MEQVTLACFSKKKKINYRLLQYKLKTISTRIQFIIPTFKLFVNLLLSLYISNYELPLFNYLRKPSKLFIIPSLKMESS